MICSILKAQLVYALNSCKESLIIKLTSITILKLTMTLLDSGVPSAIPSTLALMTDDPTTVSGIELLSRIGNNVD